MWVNTPDSNHALQDCPECKMLKQTFWPGQTTIEKLCELLTEKTNGKMYTKDRVAVTYLTRTKG